MNVTTTTRVPRLEERGQLLEALEQLYRRPSDPAVRSWARFVLLKAGARLEPEDDPDEGGAPPANHEVPSEASYLRYLEGWPVSEVEVRG